MPFWAIFHGGCASFAEYVPKGYQEIKKNGTKVAKFDKIFTAAVEYLLLSEKGESPSKIIKSKNYA